MSRLKRIGPRRPCRRLLFEKQAPFGSIRGGQSQLLEGSALTEAAAIERCEAVPYEALTHHPPSAHTQPTPTQLNSTQLISYETTTRLCTSSDCLVCTLDAYLSNWVVG